jgi:putative spermidine/putrescine transport system substrate-binding protein
MKFLDIVGRAEYQAVFARLMYYAPQNPKALDLLEPAIARLMPTYPRTSDSHTSSISSGGPTICR